MPVYSPQAMGKFCGQAVYNPLPDMQGSLISRFAQKLRTTKITRKTFSIFLNFRLSKQP